MSDEQHREAFEAWAQPMGFDLTRHHLVVPEPWAEYLFSETGYLWAGYLAGIEAATQREPGELCPACAAAEFERVSGFGELK